MFEGLGQEGGGGGGAYLAVLAADAVGRAAGAGAQPTRGRVTAGVPALLTNQSTRQAIVYVRASPAACELPGRAYLQQAAVALLAGLHVEVAAAWPPQEALGRRHVEQAHAAASQKTDRQVGRAAAAELLTRQEPVVVGGG